MSELKAMTVIDAYQVEHTRFGACSLSEIYTRVDMVRQCMPFLKSVCESILSLSRLPAIETEAQ